MTLSVDWTQVDQPGIRLSLYRTPSEWYGVVDQVGRVFFPPTQDLQVCLRFMAAMARKKDALIDDASVEAATWHSVRVPEWEGNVVPFRKASA